MLGVFLDRDSLDCGDLDFSDLDRILPHLDYYAATPPSRSLHASRKPRW